MKHVFAFRALGSAIRAAIGNPAHGFSGVRILLTGPTADATGKINLGLWEDAADDDVVLRDHERVLRAIPGVLSTLVPGGVVPIGLARNVYNLGDYSEDFSNVAWLALGGASVTGTNNINFPSVSGQMLQNTMWGGSDGQQFVMRIELSGSGTTHIAIVNADLSSVTTRAITLTSTPTVYSVAVTLSGATANQQIYMRIQREAGDIATLVIANEAQLQDKTGSATAVIPDEYQKTDSGAGLYGFCYYATENGNTVDGPGIVTDAMGYWLSPAPHMRHSPGNTNLCLQSSDLSTTWANTWNGGVTLTANATAAPDGTTTADEITQIDGITDGMNQVITLTLSTEYTASAYIKNNDATQSELSVWDDNAAAELASLTYDWDGVTPSTNASNGATYIKYEELANDWWRVSFTFTTAGTVTTHQYLHIPESLAAATNSIYAWESQIEAGLLSPPINTTTAPISRDATDINHVFAGYFNQSSFTVLMDHEWAVDQSVISAEGLLSVQEASASVMHATSTGFKSSDGTLTASVNPVFTADTKWRCIVSGEEGGNFAVSEYDIDGFGPWAHGTPVAYDGAFTEGSGLIHLCYNNDYSVKIHRVEIRDKIMITDDIEEIDFDTYQMALPDGTLLTLPDDTVLTLPG